MVETGEVQKHQPAGLRQPQVGETPIQFRAPATRELRQLHGEAMLLGVHEACIPAKTIISELTTASIGRQAYQRPVTALSGYSGMRGSLARTRDCAVPAC